ncbi:MAG: hypothetical protein DHS20C18_22880 [Saprospiraceae bacterium]|nr:MAG: hypothetical protein DHS20C18_22880 [Saprospiraceae bacterium]
MRQILLSIALLLAICDLYAQHHFPVKLDKKWGLIDSNGKLVLDPVYDAIGDFKQFGYAVMQRKGGVGLLNRSGKEIVPPNFDDIRVLDSTLIAAMDRGEWMVINLNGDIILEKGYSRVQLWANGHLAYLLKDKWGVVDKNGRTVAFPLYDEIYLEEDRYLLTRRGDQMGLLAEDGREILYNIAKEIKILNDSIFFYREGNSWGAVDDKGRTLIEPKYDTYRRLSDGFIKLVSNNRFFIYSVACSNIITDGDFDEYYAFSRRYIIVKKKRQLGLVDWCGNLVLQPIYAEIQSYERGLFRVNYQGKWGVVKVNDEPLINFDYDYIAPLRGRVCVVRKANKFGLVNFKGKEVVGPDFDRIELDGNQAKAYTKQKGEEEMLTLLSFDEEGNLTDNDTFTKHFQIKIGGKNGSNDPNENDWDESNYQLEKFEWFYSPVEDRWGLRRLSDGSIHIEPKFHYVQVERDLGFTLVGIEKYGKYEFERTTYRFEMIYGLVNNEVGLPVTEVDFWDVRFDDFREGNPVARCVFSNGRHGLIDGIGRVLLKDYAFIGPFQQGVARMSISGKLSGSMKSKKSLGKLSDYLNGLLSPNYMVDYTKYDQLFRHEAMVTCEDCSWGYLDTTAHTVIAPQYTFVENFTNDVGLVECDDKWGMINRKGDTLIPCKYDGIQFLENTNNQIVRVYVQAPKYGLIDTLGQLTVSAIYDELGDFSEGRLAVMRNGMWGFVNSDGLEVIPCRFREVKNFSEGLAAVKLGNNWGFIDKQGNVEIEFQYSRIGNFNDGKAWVYTDKGVGFVNREGGFDIPPKYEKAFDFCLGVARVVSNGKYGLIDKYGESVLRPRFGNIDAFNQYGLAIVRYGNERIRYGVINLKGEKVTRTDFVQIGPFREGLAMVKDKDGYGYINQKGDLVVPCIYSKASPFSEGKAAVYYQGDCGYISKEGEKVINFEFSRCQDFDEGKAVVYRGIRKAGIIDELGNYILEPSVDRLLQFKEGRGLVRDEKYRFYYITEQANLYDGYYQRASEFKHGVAVVKMDGKWGIINQRGIEVIPPKYDKIEGFKNGYAKVRIEGFSGLTNLKGELIAKPDYELISYAGEGLFRAEQGDKVGYFDMEGNWVWGLTK